MASSNILKLSDLPTEALKKIFTKVLETSVTSFFRVAKTCRRFRQVIQDNMLPQLCEGTMTHAAGVSLCNMIDLSVARNWLEEAKFYDSYDNEDNRSCTELAQAFLMINTHLKTGGPKVVLHEPSRHEMPHWFGPLDVTNWLDRFQKDNGITFKDTSPEPNPVLTHLGMEYEQFVKHPHCRVETYMNVYAGTFGFHVKDNDEDCSLGDDYDDEYFDMMYEENENDEEMPAEPVVPKKTEQEIAAEKKAAKEKRDIKFRDSILQRLNKRYKVYDTRSAFHGGHVTAYHMFFNTFCVGTSNGRIYVFRVKSLDDLYRLDMAKPDYEAQVELPKAILQIRMIIGDGTLNIAYTHREVPRF